VVFGLGYGLERLIQVEWLRRLAVYYCGSIDTHGFAILNRLRADLPHVRSFPMDRGTLLTHRRLWGQEPPACRHTDAPPRLDADERALYGDLVHDRLGKRIRLGQDRIGYGWAERALEGIITSET